MDYTHRLFYGIRRQILRGLCKVLLPTTASNERQQIPEIKICKDFLNFEGFKWHRNNLMSVFFRGTA